MEESKNRNKIILKVNENKISDTLKNTKRGEFIALVPILKTKKGHK